MLVHCSNFYCEIFADIYKNHCTQALSRHEEIRNHRQALRKAPNAAAGTACAFSHAYAQKYVHQLTSTSIQIDTIKSIDYPTGVDFALCPIFLIARGAEP